MNLIRVFTTFLILSLTSATAILAAQVFQDPDSQKLTLQLDKDEVAIFGYGSLMLREQLHTHDNQPYSGPFLKAYLPGFKRSWSANYPNNYSFNAYNEPMYNDNHDYFIPNSHTYLNIEPASNSTVNGILFVSPKSDLPSYDDRESSYNRIDVTHKLLNINIIGGKAFAYTAKPEHLFHTENTTPNDTIIYQHYVDIIEEALSTLGNQFRQDYKNSTQPLPTHLVFE